MRTRFAAVSLGVLGTSVLVCAGCASTPSNERIAYIIPQGCYTDEEIDQMPLLDRPDRPDHPVGNAIRRVYRWQADEE